MPAPEAPRRGSTVDIGGRGLRIVRAGPADGPLCILEHGAFGCASDWAVVQAQLAAKGIRSLAYDRAGLGDSDPGPAPRDGEAIVDDLERLLRALDESGPLLLAGHSMGGLMVRLEALAWPERTLGVVLVDAVTPAILDDPGGAKFVLTYVRAMRWVTLAAKAGAMRLYAKLAGDLIGLDPEASADKRRIYGTGSHAIGAAAEVVEWPATSKAAAAADFDTRLPIAVVAAGPVDGPRAWLKTIQARPAEASTHGYVEHVSAASHASLLGPCYADAIVRGIEHVLAKA
ncbi:alpha/beta hydrolase [Phenylobacterium immobile]|uniref:alpha/beta hydrolase n=1 Tax=Phenylobacterium immobile TaxID=21 RepID=UPI000A869D56|nr:alpha/beta fold hydrolase [Phenylobacterium immobile]